MTCWSAGGYDAVHAVLVCYGGAGFEPGLTDLDDTLTIDPDYLYADA